MKGPMMEHRGREWKLLRAGRLENPLFAGWKTVIRVPPEPGRVMVEVFENSLSMEDEEDDDLRILLHNVGVLFDGEVLDIKCIRTEATRMILSVVVSSVRFQDKV